MNRAPINKRYMSLNVWTFQKKNEKRKKKVFPSNNPCCFELMVQFIVKCMICTKMYDKLDHFFSILIKETILFSRSLMAMFLGVPRISEPRHDKTNKMSVRPAKTQISLGIRPVWSESSLSAWRKLGSLSTHWAHVAKTDQSGWMPRLIWVFAGRTFILLVLSCRGSSPYSYR